MLVTGLMEVAAFELKLLMEVDGVKEGMEETVEGAKLLKKGLNPLLLVFILILLLPLLLLLIVLLIKALLVLEMAALARALAVMEEGCMEGKVAPERAEVRVLLPAPEGRREGIMGVM